MNTWTSGYVADIGYTYGYYQELNPLRVNLAFLHSGLVPPEVGTACELGFGQGLSANMHAAASVTKWYGTDFNPSQAAFAREVSEATGSNAKLYDESFAEFAARSDLPDFDYIGLHGIWSWVNDENRHVIVDFIRRKLKVGGVVYISYNTLPGWSSFAPMRHLMTQHAEIIGSEGHGIVSRIEGALEFTEKLFATKPVFVRANPLVAERITMMKGQNRHYLAHEYFNKDLHPMYIANLAEWLQPAKLSYACSAHYLDHVDAVNLSPEQQEFLKSVPDLVLRESVRDFMINQQFRRDYWVKGARRLTPLEQLEALRKQKLILITPRADVPLKVSATIAEASLSASIYTPFLDLLADHKPRTIGQIEAALAEKGLTFTHILEACVVLAGAGHLAAVQAEAIQQKAKPVADKLNGFMINKSRSSNDIAFLASPVTGGGISVGRFPQLFLLSLSQGKRQPSDWAEMTWIIIQSQGQKLIKDGRTLESADENLAELKLQAAVFAEKQVPILRALSIV